MRDSKLTACSTVIDITVENMLREQSWVSLADFQILHLEFL